jgi:hypothetical protein
MPRDEEYGGIDDWPRPDGFTCDRYGKLMDLPRKDGLYEYGKCRSKINLDAHNATNPYDRKTWRLKNMSSMMM